MYLLARILTKFSIMIELYHVPRSTISEWEPVLYLKRFAEFWWLLISLKFVFMKFTSVIISNKKTLLFPLVLCNCENKLEIFDLRLRKNLDINFEPYQTRSIHLVCHSDLWKINKIFLLLIKIHIDELKFFQTTNQLTERF